LPDRDFARKDEADWKTATLSALATSQRVAEPDSSAKGLSGNHVRENTVFLSEELAMLC
jgi:hypothetical protein